MIVSRDMLTSQLGRRQSRRLLVRKSKRPGGRVLMSMGEVEDRADWGTSRWLTLDLPSTLIVTALLRGAFQEIPSMEQKEHIRMQSCASVTQFSNIESVPRLMRQRWC